MNAVFALGNRASADKICVRLTNAPSDSADPVARQREAYGPAAIVSRSRTRHSESEYRAIPADARPRNFLV